MRVHGADVLDEHVDEGVLGRGGQERVAYHAVRLVLGVGLITAEESGVLAQVEDVLRTEAVS